MSLVFATFLIDNSIIVSGGGNLSEVNAMDSSYHCLIVDSSFRSRRALLSSINESSVFSSLHEAKSVTDGLLHLRQSEVDTCLLGPSLSNDSSSNFIMIAKQSPNGRLCSYIAVVTADEKATNQVLGADQTLSYPFRPHSFQEICAEAAKRGRAKRIAYFQEASAIESEKLVTKEPLYLALQKVAFGLSGVADEIRAGNLLTKADGKPSLATLDAIRCTIEDAFFWGSGSMPNSGTYDEYFVRCLLTWFCDRTNLSRSEASQLLLDRLLLLAELKSQ